MAIDGTLGQGLPFRDSGALRRQGLGRGGLLPKVAMASQTPHWCAGPPSLRCFDTHGIKTAPAVSTRKNPESAPEISREGTLPRASGSLFGQLCLGFRV